MKVSNGRTSRPWGTVLGLASAFLACACAVEPLSDEPNAPEGTVVETDADGSVLSLRLADNAAVPSAQSEEGRPGEDSEGAPGGIHDKVDCAYVQWCNAPASASASGFDWGTVCRVRSGCAFAVGYDECSRDVRAICGGWTWMSLVASARYVL